MDWGAHLVEDRAERPFFVRPVDEPASALMRHPEHRLSMPLYRTNNCRVAYTRHTPSQDNSSYKTTLEWHALELSCMNLRQHSIFV